MQLTREEQEVHIHMSADNPDKWHCYVDYPAWQRKLERAGTVIVKEYPSGGKEYTLERRQISIRKLAAKRDITPEQRQASRERLKNALEAKKIKNETT